MAVWLRPLRRIAFRLSLLICGLILACGMGEAVVRLANAGQHNDVIETWRYAKLLQRRSSDPAVDHELIPGASARLEGVMFSVNSLGMRGPEPDLTAAKAKILIFGDSIALGWGVAEADTLRGQLAARLPADEVMNAGVSDMTMSQMVARGLHYTGKIRPKVVIVLATLRAPAMAKPHDVSWLVHHSAFYVELRMFLLNLRMPPTSDAALAAELRQKWLPGPGRAQMEAALDRLKADQKKYGYRVIVVMVPAFRNFHPYRYGFMSKILARQAALRGWRFVDPLPALNFRPARSYWVASDNSHPNRDAFRIMADMLAPLLAAPARAGP